MSISAVIKDNEKLVVTRRADFEAIQKICIYNDYGLCYYPDSQYNSCVGVDNCYYFDKERKDGN